ncbi:Syntaxin-22, partial [Bienertia sinuspersici]
MSFQDIRNNGGIRPASSKPQTPSQSIAAGIFQINTAVTAFRRLVDAIGTSKDTPNHRQKMHNTRQRILQLVKDTSSKLKALSESDHAANISQSKKIEDAKLARDFQATLQEFQKVQQLASERESSYMPSGAQTSADQESQPFLVEQKRQELVLLDNEIAFNEAIIDEREQGIKEIQSQIGQVNEIFKDLAVLVHEQGVVIDDIHSNVDASAAATTQARQQLSKASKSERSGSTWKEGGRRPSSVSELANTVLPLSLHLIVFLKQRLPESKKVLDLMLAKSFRTTLKEFQNAQMLAQEREFSYMLFGATTSAAIDSTIEDAKQDLESQPILLDQS